MTGITATAIVSEPATLLTDYILASFSAAFGILLLRKSPRSHIRAWGIGFLTLAAAGLTGGSFHGFRHMMNDGNQRTLWNATLVLIGMSAGFMIAAALTSSLKRGSKNTQWLAAGLILSIAGLVIQQSGLAIHAGFNHNDLFHCVQTVALYLLFRGAQATA